MPTPYTFASTARRRFRPVAVTGLLVLAAAAPAGGGGFVSDRDRNLSIAAAGGLEHGASLRLRASCRPGVKECGWTFNRGRLASEAEPDLVISYFETAQAGRELRIVNCPTRQPRCQWVWENGMFRSAEDPSLAISVERGARHGARLVLRSNCVASNPECTWSRQ